MNFKLVITFLLLIHPALGFSSEYTKLSDYFSVKKVSPFWDNEYSQIFYTPATSKKHVFIGNIEKENWNKLFSGKALTSLKRSVFAIAKDGKSILYRHINKGFFGHHKKEGVYWFHIEHEERLLYPSNSLANSWSKQDKPLPKDVLIIKKYNSLGYSSTKHEDIMILYAENAQLRPLGLYGGNKLHEAVYTNNYQQVKSLIDQGEHIDALTYWVYSPLDIAIKKGFDDIAIFLIEHGADFINKKRHELSGEHSTIEAAVFLQRWKVLNAMQKKGARFNDPELFKQALFYNHGELIVDDTSQVQGKGVPKMIRLLLEDGNNPNAKGLNIITRLVTSDWLRGSLYQLETLKILLKAGANPSAIRLDQSSYNFKRTALHHIVASSHWKIKDAKQIMYLLAKYSKHLEHKDKFGLTALQTSMLSFNDNSAKALYLIKLGADDTVEYHISSEAHKTGLSVRAKLDLMKTQVK